MIAPIVEVILELVLQLFGELLVEVGLKAIGSEHKRGPLLALFGYVLLGGLLGALSLLWFPDSFVTTESMRLLNLFLAPTAAGLIMAAIGRIARKRNPHYTVHLASFGRGFAFAFALNLVRFFLGA